MPEFYNLEEAARVLGLSPEALKEQAQHRQIRAFMDSGSWRFRKVDIDEEARRRGMGSDPELSLSDLDLIAQGASDSGHDVDLSEFQLGLASPDPNAGPPSEDELARSPADDESDADILLDDLSAPPDRSASSSSTIIGMAPISGKLPSDSDVRLVPDESTIKSASDSDVRLGAAGVSDSDVKLAGSEPEVHEARPEPIPDADDSTLLHSYQIGGSSAELVTTPEEQESDFELTPSSVIDALEPESGSDFELTPLDASSDEYETTPLGGGPSDSDVTGAMPSKSGINLGQPSDSGINLLAVGGFDVDSAESIELAPLDDEPAAPKAPTSPPRPQPEMADMAATALPSRTEKDLFEDTDFEVDALDVGDEDRTVQLDAPSDFDIDDSQEMRPDSASEVFAIDEEDVDENAATALGPAVFQDEEEEDIDVGEAALSEAESSAWEVEEPVTPSSASRFGSPVLAAGAAGPEWGGLWVSLLGVATVLMMLLAFVGMDVVRNLYEFRSDGPASGLVQMLSGLMG